MKRRFKVPSARAWVLLVGFALLAGVGWSYQSAPKEQPSIVLLVPDDAALSQPVTQAWVDAASEEGIALTVMTDHDFLRRGDKQRRIAGVILPDMVHQQASDMLVNQLHRYVGEGGRLFIAYDATLLDLQNATYAGEQSRLSTLAGVRYGMYAQLKDQTIATGAVFATRESEKTLGFQAGKFEFAAGAEQGELTTYGYDHLLYSHFRTEPASGAHLLLVSARGDVIVSTHRTGKGEVLFANLPLGYLKTRTDGFLLHQLLGHFAGTMLQLPRLSPVPEGIGGLVLNLHVDSNAALKPLESLEQAGWFRQGPFSIHVTAGPDSEREGDGLGVNLQSNPHMQAFLKRQMAQGHEVGDHGGWIHNLFGRQASEDNRERFEPMLGLNQASMKAATGTVPRIYSAPMGNQPQWTTTWLRREGFKGYYCTGNNGLGPTRSYEMGHRPEPSSLWAFPISSYLRVATFEELASAEPPVEPQALAAYLSDLTRFVANQHVARLFYFHPPAATLHLSSLDVLTAESRRLAGLGRFRWYTMEQLSDFLNRRALTQWQATPAEGLRGGFTASSPAQLDQLAWVVPKGARTRCKVIKGVATVREDGPNWIVTAGPGQALEVRWE